MLHRKTPSFAALVVLALSGAMLLARPAAAFNGPLLLVEAASGKVLHAENATYPWYPASVTKLVTAYVTLRAVKDGRLRLDSLLTVSENALAQQPSKMGFAVGTRVTVDNALKMLMVKSANDIAVVLAEGVSGSVEKFADEMNRTSQRLGMTQSTWVNPNGLPADEQITSARDMAILARAILRDFPEYEFYWRIPAIKFGRKLMRNTNFLIDRYPGADGMKTGFICASGFNLVATATRDGKRLIAVVMGAPSSPVRAERAANLFEKGFTGGLSWLLPSLGNVDQLVAIAAAPPNLREDMCGRNRKRPASESDEEDVVAANQPDGSAAYAAVLPLFRGRNERGPLIGPLTPSMAPVPVFVGAPKQPPPQVASQPAEAKPKPAAATGKPKEDARATARPAAASAKDPAGRKTAATDAKAADAKQRESNAKPADAKPGNAKPVDSKPADAKSKPAAGKASEQKPAPTARPGGGRPATAKATDGKATGGESPNEKRKDGKASTDKPKVGKDTDGTPAAAKPAPGGAKPASAQAASAARKPKD